MHKNIKVIAAILSTMLLLTVCAACSKEEQPLTQVSEQMVIEEPVSETEAAITEDVTEEVAAVEEVEVIAEPVVIEINEIPEIVTGELQLSQEDMDLLAAMEPDIITLDDASFPETVTEMMHHVGSYTGKVYQLEGVYSTQLDGNGTAYLYRILVNGEVKTTAVLPIVYFADEIAENSWVRVTAIIGEGEINGVQSTVLEVVAIENTEPGNAELAWSGSAHDHS